jgi:hypothetical protein
VLFAGTTDRGGVALGPDLLPKKTFEGMPIGAGAAVFCLSPNAAALAFDGPLADCQGVRAPAPEVPATRFDALAAATVVSPEGVAHLVVAAREPGGKLRVRFGEDAAQTRFIDGVGAQIAVADLDQDGVPEFATTQESGPDELSVVSWAGKDLRARLRIPAPLGVRALAVCPAEEKAVPALVAVVGPEVWIIR